MPRKQNLSVLNQLYGGRLRPTPALPQEEKPRPKHTGMAMSVEDMANELAIGRNVAYQLVQQPGFPSFEIGRRVLVSRKGLQEWIDAQCKKGPGASALPEVPSPETLEK